MSATASQSGAGPAQRVQESMAAEAVLTMTLRSPAPAPVDMSPLTPDALAGMRWAEIEALSLCAGTKTVRVAELFDVEGDGTANVVIRSSSPHLVRVGAGMTRGRITVEGEVGMYAGAEMRGGTLMISGDAGALAGCAMHDGLLHIRGSVGDFAAAALPGARRGMDGGTMIVEGDAGDRLGDRMRRGLLLIAGDAGDYCGARMLAGTIVVRGTVGAGAGAGMQRGTLMVATMPPLLGTFSDCGTHALPFLPVLRKHLIDAGPPSARFTIGERVRRFVGDRAYAGLGEILVSA
ncbi:MAG TPA: formylmethanofuran dehydrogenase subunit C [Casimicrobiaceae bacterium]|nr:formylmethanofuran dehydrogenase subunit C [Casimicrobiaceae bacterium]